MVKRAKVVRPPHMTTIEIKKTTRQRLSDHMKHKQSYDEFIDVLLEAFDSKENR